jgi:hypothetical protein
VAPASRRYPRPRSWPRAVPCAACRVRRKNEEGQSRRECRAAEEKRPTITAIVQYKLPPHIDLAACVAHSRDIAPGFRAVPGLIRKQFIYAEDGRAGGVYLWETWAAAEAFYTGPWLDGIRERYGLDPQT